MVGTMGEAAEPITWTREYKGPVAYTALGHPDDFEQPQFQKLLTNMIFWAMGRTTAK